MPRNGSGIYGLPAGTTAVPNTPIESAKYNAATTDIAQALTDSINVQGTAPFQADQPMGGHKLTGLSAGVAAGDSATLGQVQSSIMAHAAIVGGTTDAIALTFSPAFEAYTAKMRFRFTASGANTTTTPTVNVDGLGAKTIKKLNGQALIPGDIAGAGHVVDCVYDGTDILIISASAVSDASETVKGVVELATTAEVKAGTDIARAVTVAGVASVTRYKLTADTTYYVRTDGDDTNDGSANDAEHAFLTGQGADNFLNSVDFNGQTVTIQFADGTYNDPIVVGRKVGLTEPGKYIFKGDVAAVGDVILDTTGSCFVVSDGAMCQIMDMELNCSGLNSIDDAAIRCAWGGIVEYGNIHFGEVVGGLSAHDGGMIRAISDYSVERGVDCHFAATRRGEIKCSGRTITLTGSGGFVIWAQATANGLTYIVGNDYVGTAGVTGQRVVATTGGGVSTGGVTQPGNSSGTTTSPGWST